MLSRFGEEHIIQQLSVDRLDEPHHSGFQFSIPHWMLRQDFPSQWWSKEFPASSVLLYLCFSTLRRSILIAACCVEAECHFCHLRDSGLYVHESRCPGNQRHLPTYVGCRRFWYGPLTKYGSWFPWHCGSVESSDPARYTSHLVRCVS